MPSGTCNDTSMPGCFRTGYVPLVIPWLSIPQLSLHIRPHRNFDIRIDAGYGLINYYLGGALHFVL